jgi:hypothetical protein
MPRAEGTRPLAESWASTWLSAAHCRLYCLPLVTGYTGTDHFSSADSTATLPQNYTFTAADAGVHTFGGVTLRKRSQQTITVTDTLNSGLTATDSIKVT